MEYFILQKLSFIKKIRSLDIIPVLFIVFYQKINLQKLPSWCMVTDKMLANIDGVFENDGWVLSASSQNN